MIIATLAILLTVSVVANITILYLTGKGLEESESSRKNALTLAIDAMKEALLWKGLCLDMVEAVEALEAKNVKNTPRDTSGFVQ